MIEVKLSSTLSDRGLGVATTTSPEILDHIEESQRQLRDSIETSKRMVGEAQALVDQTRNEGEQESPSQRAASATSC